MDKALGELFKVCQGWFENFRKRAGIHLLFRHDKVLRADMKAAEDYIKTFIRIITVEGYSCQQVFNCDEMGPFLKKMPKRQKRRGCQTTNS